MTKTLTLSDFFRLVQGRFSIDALEIIFESVSEYEDEIGREISFEDELEDILVTWYEHTVAEFNTFTGSAFETVVDVNNELGEALRKERLDFGQYCYEPPLLCTRSNKIVYSEDIIKTWFRYGKEEE